MVLLDTRMPLGTPGCRAKAHTAQEIHDMLDRAVRLLAENKITKDNAWDLNIIDYMPSLVETLSREDHFNFQKTSVALHASAQVYSKRVDSAYEDVYASISGINVKNGGAVRQGPEDEQVPDSAAGQASRARKHDADPASTIAKSEAALRGKEVNETFEHDPMFYRLTKLFDESSAAGLMMLNVPAYYQEQLMLSATEVPMDAFPQCVPPTRQPESKQVHVKGLHRLSELLQAHMDAEITPSILGLHAKADPEACNLVIDDEDIVRSAIGVQGRPKGHGLPRAAPEGQQGWGGSSACENRDNGSVQAPGSPGFEDAQDVGMEDAWQGDDGGAGDEDNLGADEPPLAFGMAEDDWPGADDLGCEDDIGRNPDQTGGDSDEEASQVHSCVSQMASYLDMDGQRQQQQPKHAARSSAWAGSSFWKFRSKVAPAAESGAEKPAARGRAKPKAAFKFHRDQVPDLSNIAAVEDAAQLQLKRATHTVTLLPRDMHMKESQLFCLPGLPNKTVLDIWSGHQAAQRASKRSQAHAPAPPGTPFVNAGADQSFGDDDGGCGGFDDDFGTCEGSEGFTRAPAGAGGDVAQAWDFEHLNDEQLMDQLLLPAPRKVAKMDLTYDKAAKQVDVKALKDMLGHNIKSLWAKEQEQQQQQQQDTRDQDKGFTFQEVIELLPPGSLGNNGEVSVHICFVCLLHLANENSLALSNHGSLGSLGITC